MRTDYYVYILFRETGIPLYVGKGVDDRWNHAERALRRSDGSHLHRALISIQKRRHDIPKIKVAEGLTNIDAKKLEILLIAVIGREPTGPLINQTRGGDGLCDADPSIGKKISEKLKGHPSLTRKKGPQSPEHRAKTVAVLARVRPKAHAANRGRKRSPETTQKMRIKRAGKIWITDEVTILLHNPTEPIPEGWRRGARKGKRAGVKPYIMTQTVRNNMSKAKTGAHWFTNGVTNKLVHVGHEPPEGWVRGRCS